MLIDDLTILASRMYKTANECDCSFCKKYCSDGCRKKCEKCLEDIHFAQDGTARDYNCEKMIAYYICQNAHKYSSEIQHFLSSINTRKFSSLKILSIGCGSAPDLIGTFDYLTNNNIYIPITYHGIDKNSLWEPYQNFVKANLPTNTFFLNSTVEESILKTDYNIVILQYLFSTYLKVDNKLIDRFEDIYNMVYPKIQTGGYIVINDVNHYNVGRDLLFDAAKAKMPDGFDVKGYSFENYKNRDDWFETKRPNQDLFYKSIPQEVKINFETNSKCSSAQIIMEKIR